MNTADSKKPRKGSKDEAMLKAFVLAGDTGINAPEAAFHHHDLCLHSTASRFKRVYGIVLCSKSETFGRFGSMCSRYRLSGADRPRVAAMLGEVGA